MHNPSTRKVILQEFVTIDGFAADPKDGLEFSYPFAGDEAISRDSLAFIKTIDTILLGDITYRGFVTFWPTATNEDTFIADALNATPKIVFSQTLKGAPWGKWESAMVIKNRAEHEVAKLKQQPGKDMVIWGSITLAQSLMKAGLIDEYHLRVCPVAIGVGRQLFPKDIGLHNMTLLEAKTYKTGLVLLRYQPNQT